MSTLSISSRYAQALLKHASDQGILASTYTSMLVFHQTCSTSKSLTQTLKSPLINPGKKIAIVHKIFQHKVNELTLSFLKLVSQKKRAAILPDITQEFLKQYNTLKGIQTAQVTTTYELPSDLVEDFKHLIKKLTRCQEVVLTQHINPAILGGYILRIADKQLDQSLKTQLYSLKKRCIASQATKSGILAAG